jgi:glycosyltransferase involved in cell wall biosynthesis
MKEKISLVAPYYETKQMLEKQLETWHSYPKELRQQLEFIIVDDGSPDNPAVIDACDLNLILARVQVNIPWNHPGSQNLGASLATSKWLWSGGIDHVFTEDNMIRLLSLDRSNYKVNYKIPRRASDGTITYHWEINYLSRETFWSIGGYDEDFAGTWGADDVCFTSMLKKSGVAEVKIDPTNVCLDLYTEADFKEANSHHHTDKLGWGARKMNPKNKGLWLAKVAGRKPYGQNPIRFPWAIEKRFHVK